MTRTRICTDILLLSILLGNLTGKKSQRAAEEFWNQRALKVGSENRAVFPSALNLLLLMRKHALVWVNTFDQRGHLLYSSHRYKGTLSKLTLSLSSTYKWAVQMKERHAFWTITSYLSMWLVGAPAGRAENPSISPSCRLCHKQVWIFCFPADVSCGQSYLAVNPRSWLSISLLSNIQFIYLQSWKGLFQTLIYNKATCSLWMLSLSAGVA